MKISKVIKADFFINPEKYGVNPDRAFLKAIWANIIKPIVKNIETSTTIDNEGIRKYIEGYREQIRRFLSD